MRAVGALVLVALLAGCTECVGPSMTSRGLAADLPSSAGRGEQELVLEVHDAVTGAPVHDARVRAYFPVNASTETYCFFGCVTSLRAGLVHADLVTDENGSAALHAPQHAQVRWVVSHPHRTEEWTQAEARSTLGLYPSSVQVKAAEAWDGAGVTFTYVGLNDEQGVDWRPSALQWTGDAGTDAQLNRRIAGLEVWLNWTTDAGRDADMGLALGTDDQEVLVYHNSEDELLDWGGYSEHIVLDLDDLEALGAVADDALFAGPTTAARVAPLGVEYTIEMQARIAPKQLRDRFCLPDIDHADFVMGLDAFERQYDRADEDLQPGIVGRPPREPQDPDGPDGASQEASLPLAVAAAALAVVVLARRR